MSPRYTPWQYTVIALSRGVDSLRNDATPPPPGFAALFDGLKAAARVEPLDTTHVATNLRVDTTPADDGAMNELITLDRAAGEVGRHRRTLERHIGAGTLAVHRDGRRVFVRRGDLEDLWPTN